MQKYLTLSIGLGIVFFIMYASYGLAFYYGASLVVQGTCTPGSIFTVGLHHEMNFLHLKNLSKEFSKE